MQKGLAMGTFSDISKFIEKTNKNADLIMRKIAIDLIRIAIGLRLLLILVHYVKAGLHPSG